MLKAIYRGVGAAVLALAVLTMPASAEEPVATELAVAEAEDYLGLWKLAIEVMGMNFELILNVADVDGMVGATLDSERQAEALAIPTIAKTDDGGLELSGELKFGDSFALDIIINVVRDGEGLGGRVKDTGGIFNAELVGTPMTEEELDSVQGRRPDPTEARLLVGDKRVRIAFAELTMDSSDWALFENLEDGEVHKFTLSRATKMYTDLDLLFGDVLVKKENVAEDYPGVYSVWLKKAGDGWHLVFNEKPDIWGTRHDPEFDVAEVPLTVTNIEGDPQTNFLMELNEGEDGGTLVIRWGNTEWSTPFSVIEEDVPAAAPEA
jgi:hypothetical protein